MPLVIKHDRVTPDRTLDEMANLADRALSLVEEAVANDRQEVRVAGPDHLVASGLSK